MSAVILLDVAAHEIGRCYTLKGTTIIVFQSKSIPVFNLNIFCTYLSISLLTFSVDFVCTMLWALSVSVLGFGAVLLYIASLSTHHAAMLTVHGIVSTMWCTILCSNALLKYFIQRKAKFLSQAVSAEMNINWRQAVYALEFGLLITLWIAKARFAVPHLLILLFVATLILMLQVVLLNKLVEARHLEDLCRDIDEKLLDREQEKALRQLKSKVLNGPQSSTVAKGLHRVFEALKMLCLVLYAWSAFSALVFASGI